MNIIVSLGVEQEVEAKCRLKIILIEKDITQKEFANMLGATQQQVSDWSRGRTVPKIDTLLRILKVLDCSLNDLYKL